MTQQTLTRLRHLKLTGMADAVQQQLEQASTYEGLPFIERLSLLVEHEQLSREQRKQARLVKQARLKLQATVQEVDYQSARNLERSQVANLAQGEWLRRGQNLLITGPCGCGKTYLACALGYQACQQGHSTRYYRLPRLLLELSQAKVDGSYARLLGQLARIELLILDDWGLEAVNAEQRNALLEIMDDRYGKYSTVVVSQLPTEEWYASLGDNTLADAILDRLMHNAHRLSLKGESMRKRRSELTQSEHSSLAVWRPHWQNHEPSHRISSTFLLDCYPSRRTLMLKLERILHVEDDPSIRAVAKVALEAVGGFEVLSCSSGQEALDNVLNFATDLILLDVMMPGMDGPQTVTVHRDGVDSTNSSGNG